MCDPLDSQSHLDDYFGLIPNVHVVDKRQQGHLDLRILKSPVHESGSVEEEQKDIKPILEWRGAGPKERQHSLDKIHINQLPETQDTDIRVIFAKTDEPHHSTVQGLRDLFEIHKIPSVFLNERTQGVTNSWGTRNTNHNTYDSWFHFLCKNVVLMYETNGSTPQVSGLQPSENFLPKDAVPIYNDNRKSPQIYGLRAGQNENVVKGGPSWIQGGFFMKWNKTTRTIVLCCFGVFPSIEQRLKKFVESTDNVQTAISDPYTLYVIILDELHTMMDGILWGFIAVFNKTEEKMFAIAGGRKDLEGHDVDFEHLHNVEKHIIHLKEGVDAIISTVKSLQRDHGDLFKISNLSGFAPPSAFPVIEKDLEYLLNSFQGLSLRIRSVETRVKNVINLGFNLVIQRDSKLLQKDSASMSTVALMTLLFLPGTAIASMFGTQFFSADFSEEGNKELKVSTDFWLFWVVAVSITGITLLVWWYWYRMDAMKRGSLERRRRLTSRA